MEIRGGSVRVDQFGPGSRAYFLTHLHGDHAGGLRREWSRGPLYCSEVTARLLACEYGITDDVLQVMKPHETREVRLNGEQVSVTAMEANHCPGALMFHFAWPDDRVYYTGDFRLNDEIRRDTLRFAGVDVAYVDSTYDEPGYVFPAQHEAIERVVSLVGENIDKEVFLAIYNIGKTKIVEAVVGEFGRPVYVVEKVAAFYEAMGMGGLVTRETSATNIRGYSRGYFYNYFPWKSRRYRKTHVVIIPTGWAAAYGPDPFGYICIPYSEHCDYRELCEFRDLLRPKRTVPI